MVGSSSVAREDIYVHDPQFDGYSTEELRRQLDVGGKPNRARAIGALARRAARDESLHDEIFAKLADPTIRAQRFMGTISLAHIAMACLWIAATPPVIARARQLLETWPEPDRSDLLWFLRTQDIAVE